MSRPRIPDDVAARDPHLAHAAALRDRLAELQRRVGAIFDELELCPRAVDGKHLEDNARTRELLAELSGVLQKADTIVSSIRALMKRRPA